MNSWLQPEPQNWWQIVEDALAEDLGSGDVTGGIFDPEARVRFYFEAQQDAVICGMGIVEYLLSSMTGDPDEASVDVLFKDGSRVTNGTIVARGVGYARKVLAVERTALNFLMLLSGVATLTRKFVDRVEGTEAKVIDTRKTIPLLRSLQKYAVRCGGGHNHRMGLFDGGMLKDNHIQAAGSIPNAVRTFRSYASHMSKLEVECESLAQVEEAVASGAEVVLLDNMDPFEMREAVKKFSGRCLFEASGGIDLDTVRGVAGTGVNLISVGALTHSAPAASFHMEIE